MALLWVTQPMPNDAMNVKTANATASHLQCMPRSMAYIGPPRICPSLRRTRNLTASRPSEYLVAMPRMPVNQHQKTAPGPPMVTAVATPMMLPVPMVAASPVAKALNWLTSPSAPLSRFTLMRIALKMWRCGNFRRIVRKRCVPTSNTIIGQPHK